MTQTLEDGQAARQTGRSDIGVVGLAVMGENLILNMASKGFTVSAFNRTVSKVTDFVEGRAKGQSIVGAYDLPQLVSQLSKPRKVMLMAPPWTASSRR